MSAENNLRHKAMMSGIPYGALQMVYNRGIGAWKTNPESVRLRSGEKNYKASRAGKMGKSNGRMPASMPSLRSAEQSTQERTMTSAESIVFPSRMDWFFRLSTEELELDLLNMKMAVMDGQDIGNRLGRWIAVFEGLLELKKQTP